LPRLGQLSIAWVIIISVWHLLYVLRRMFLVGIFDVLLGICAEYHKLIDYYVLKPKKKSDFDGKVTFFVPV
jgi:hypothetical protein